MLAMDAKSCEVETSSTREMVPRRPVVMIVDDEPGVLRLAKTVLDRAGYEVVTAPDAEAAQKLCADYDGRIDVLLLDIILPGTPGLELAPALLAMRPDMKLLYMGGYPSELVVGSKRAGAPFIQKPFDGNGLVARVNQLLEG